MSHVQTDYPQSTPGVSLPQLRWLWPALAGVLLVALVGVWFWRPTLPGASSPEVAFARNMAAHHGQAVEMALIMRDRTQNEELRTLALDIILTQQAQIGQMQGWLAAWSQPYASTDPPMAAQMQMPGMATEEDITALRTLPVPEAEVRFLQLMLRHHQGGVMMAQDALQATRRPEVVRLATAIVNAQQNEITYIQTLLKQRGASEETRGSMP